MRLLPTGARMQRQRERRAEHGRRRSQLGVATAERGRNVTSSNARPFSRSVDFGVGAAVDVVEDDARQPPPGGAAQVVDVDGAPGDGGITHARRFYSP